MQNLDSTIRAGQRALNSLERAKEELNSAKNWGVFDMLGGGLISTLVKHSKMDHAQEYIGDAERALKDFNNLLHGLNLSEINVDTGDLTGMLDIFLDGIFADWVMQSRINEARDAVDSAIAEIGDILKRLKAYQ